MTDSYEVGMPSSGTISTSRCAKIGQHFRNLKRGTETHTHTPHHTHTHHTHTHTHTHTNTHTPHTHTHTHTPHTTHHTNTHTHTHSQYGDLASLRFFLIQNGITAKNQSRKKGY